MRNVLIFENNTSGLDLINESVVDGNKKYILGGPFTEFNKVNRNDRVYTAPQFLPCMEELKSRMDTLGSVYGEFDHPSDFETSLKNASHVIKDIHYVKESDAVHGEIQLLSTYWGKEAKSIVNDGQQLFVSSRAAGVTESNGTVSVKKLFTYDIVADPGFGSAKMNTINESCGFGNLNNNVKVYDMQNEESTNQLFNMNKNDMVTKAQMSEYSQHVVEEIQKTKSQLNEAIQLGKMDSAKMAELVEYYENLQESHAKLVSYLDYLAEKMQVVVNKNETLEETQAKLIEHNDYLVESLEKSINYSEYIAENVNKNIAYSEYIAENLDKNIEYSEYIAENVDKNIAYSEYIAENLDKNIEYSEYIAENLDDSIQYGDYIAESLDKSLRYQETIVTKLNESSGKLFENYEEEGDAFPTPEDHGFEIIDDELEADEEMEMDNLPAEVETENEMEMEDDNTDHAEDLLDIANDLQEIADEIADADDSNENSEEDSNTDEAEIEEEIVEDKEDMEIVEESENMEIENNDNESCDCDDDNCDCNKIDESIIAQNEEDDDCEDEDEADCDDEEEHIEETLDQKIDRLIEEAKKRKASETTEHHFLKFLNKKQVDSFYSLDQDSQEKVVAYINENDNYMSDTDVLRLMQEAISIKEESLEERLIRLMPDSIKESWETLAESKKVSIFSQARLYPELVTESQVSHFWLTRNIKAKTVKKELLNESKFIQDDKLSDEAINGIMERFKSL